MTNAEARDAFIKAREDAECAEPINLPVNTLVVMGGARYRAVYDGHQDAVVLISEEEWRCGLEKARAKRAADEARERGDTLPVVKMRATGCSAEYYVPLRCHERLRIAEGGREWVVYFDSSVDAFVCRAASEAAR